jgi:hypothetical protein
MSIQSISWTALLLACAFNSGCSSYSPASLRTGSSMAEVRAKLGEPTGEFSFAGGAKRLEFARGPAGLHTFMVDFDSAGSMVSWIQALYPENFAAIKIGMEGADVLSRLGHPAQQFGVWSGRQTIWAYRYDSVFCDWFMVGMNPQGQVASASYGPDPRCNIKEPSGS